MFIWSQFFWTTIGSWKFVDEAVVEELWQSIGGRDEAVKTGQLRALVKQVLRHRRESRTGTTTTETSSRLEEWFARHGLDLLLQDQSCADVLDEENEEDDDDEEGAMMTKRPHEALI